MEYLRTNEADFIEIVRQLSDITNSGKVIKKIFDYISKHESIFDNDEYIKTRISIPRMPSGMMGMLTLDTKYSINIKKSTLLILAALLDLKISFPAASLALGMTGIASQTINRIEDKERCLLLDVFSSKKINITEFDYFKGECIQNDIQCPHRKEGLCARDINTIKKLFEDLLKREVITLRDSIYKITI